ncbi:MAG: phenylpyruvate tautomerase MIF-related protein [Cyanobacteria bacterium P01_F01_bin.42]
MPLLKVQSSITSPAQDQVQSLLKVLSGKLAGHLNKSENYVMTAFEGAVPMTFGGTDDPACYVEIKSVGTMSAQQTQAMSSEFCQEIEKNLGVPQNRIYIEFADARGAMWGWNGTTFG